MESKKFNTITLVSPVSSVQCPVPSVQCPVSTPKDTYLAPGGVKLDAFVGIFEGFLVLLELAVSGAAVGEEDVVGGVERDGRAVMFHGFFISSRRQSLVPLFFEFRRRGHRDCRVSFSQINSIVGLLF